MDKIKVFISYNWESEKELIKLIADGLKPLGNVELLIDEHFISPNDRDLYVKVKEKINESHCILVSLTSMNKSIQVACELTRAHARNKEIIIIQDERKTEERVPKYLSFLSNKLTLRYGSEHNLIEILREHFQNLTGKDFENITVNEVFSLVGTIENLYSENTLNFQKDLTKKIINEAETEIKKVYSNEYVTNVGIEKNFLIRARAIFENATRVYAVSIDKISTFWEQTKNQNLAITYISKQPKKNNKNFRFFFCKRG